MPQFQKKKTLSHVLMNISIFECIYKYNEIYINVELSWFISFRSDIAIPHTYVHIFLICSLSSYEYTTKRKKIKISFTEIDLKIENF